MKLIRGLEDCPVTSDGCAVTIGTYDGVHLGHRAVIERTMTEADRLGAQSAVVTFDPHPAMLVRPESAPTLLTSLDHKIELIADLGVDFLYVVTFDAARAAESATTFTQDVIVDCLQAKLVVVGNNFHFGRNREGSVASLRAMGEAVGFEAVGIDLLPDTADPELRVSSTATRAAIVAGDLTTATRMLGRPHEVRGVVAQGDQRGRTIGFPTANVMVPGRVCMPADGVYAGWYLREDGTRHAAAINLGRRPTFYTDQAESLLEAHLLDFDGDLYGEQASVQFVSHLRSEVRFDGIDALKTQLALDVTHAREALTDS